MKEYFSSKNGFGVLSAADETGKVDAAPYARPHAKAKLQHNRGKHGITGRIANSLT